MNDRLIGILIGALSIACFAQAEARFIYVSNRGDDSHPGTEQQPIATLHRARELLRAMDRRPNEPVAVLVGEGTYYFDETLVFEPEDSGTKDTHVVFRAAEVGRVTLSGGAKLECRWEPFRDGIYQCQLAPGTVTLLGFTQLYVDGVRQIRARYPNHDPEGDRTQADGEGETKPGYIKPLGADDWPHHAIRYNSETFTTKRWSHPDEAVLHIFANNYWGNMQWRLRSIDYDTNTLHLGEGGWQLNEVFQRSAATGVGTRSNFYIENLLEELDAPGEWYSDPRRDVLYYYPPKEVALDRALVEVSRLKHLIEFKGSKEKPVRFISFTGFRIAHTETTYLEPYESPSLGDWSIYRGGAVLLDGAEDCAVEQCFFDAIGGNGVFVSNHARRIRVYGNRFTESGESAVCLVGKSHLNPRKSYTCEYCGAKHGWGWDEPKDEYPAECLISNNLIHDIGVWGKQTAGVFLSLTMNDTISHNHIYNTPRAAICLNDGMWGGETIEFNDIHDTVRETGDHGPFNSWGRYRAWCHNQGHGSASHPPAGDVSADTKATISIRFNRFRDYRGWGIDLDDGSSNYLVYGNLCIGIGIKMREGAYRTVENNIIINPATSFNTHVCYENNHDRILRNIVVGNTQFDNPDTDINFAPGKHGGAVIRSWIAPPEGPIADEIDSNCYYSDAGQFWALFGRRGQEERKLTLEEWRALGYDKHSLYADPLFVDPDRGDFRVREDSPALQLGFRNIPMDKFGLLPDYPDQWRD